MQVLIPGGETSAMFDVRIIGDVMLESSEKLRVSIDPLSLPFGVVLGNTPTAEVVIMDDDGKCKYTYNNNVITSVICTYISTRVEEYYDNIVCCS